MTPQRFRKRPIEVEAVRWEGTLEGVIALSEWGATARSYTRWNFGRNPRLILEVETSKGVREAVSGDWVIRTAEGDFYPCQSALFDAVFEPVTP